MTRDKIKSWDEVRNRLVPADQEYAIADGVRALREAISLSELRADYGVTQVELAGRLGKSQGNISGFEHRGDVYVSSLREYVEALGGRLEVTAVFDDERRPITIGKTDDESRTGS